MKKVVCIASLAAMMLLSLRVVDSRADPPAGSWAAEEVITVDSGFPFQFGTTVASDYLDNLWVTSTYNGVGIQVASFCERTEHVEGNPLIIAAMQVTYEVHWTPTGSPADAFILERNTASAYISVGSSVVGGVQATGAGVGISASPANAAADTYGHTAPYPAAHDPSDPNIQSGYETLSMSEYDSNVGYIVKTHASVHSVAAATDISSQYAVGIVGWVAAVQGDGSGGGSD